MHKSFPVRRFNRLLLPATLLTVLDFLMVFFNAVIAGNMTGESGLAAIELVSPLVFMVEFFSSMLGQGTSYLYDQALGEADEKKANQFWGQGVLTTAGAGVLLAGFIMLFRPLFFRIYNADAEIIAHARQYLNIMLLDFLIEPYYFLIYEMVFSDGDEKLSLLTNLTHIPIQLGLSVPLCGRLGLPGIALAQVISKIISLGMFSLHFFRKCNTMRFTWFFSWRMLKDVVAISMADAVLNLCWMGTQMILNKLTLVWFGSKLLPVITILCSVFELCLLFDGIGAAFAPLVNIYFGEKNFRPLRILLRHSFFVSLIEGCAATAILFAVAPLLPAFYGLTDPALARETVRALRVLAFSFPGIVIVFDISSAYVMTDHGGLATLMVIISHFAGNVLTALVIGRRLGTAGLSLSYVLAPIIALLVFVPILKQRRGQYVLPWLITKPSENMLYLDGAGEPEQIISMRDAAEAFLIDRGMKKKAQIAMMLIEELGMLLLEKNRKKIALEFTVTVDGDEVMLSERDSGEIFDVTEQDAAVINFRGYFVDRLLKTVSRKRHMVSMGFNRNLFRF